MKIEIGEQLGFKIAHLGPLRDEVREIVERFVKPRRVYRLAEVIASAAFDGFDRGVHRIMAGHQDHVDAGIDRERFFQEFHSVHSRHVNIGKNYSAVSAMHDFQHLKWIG